MPPLHWHENCTALDSGDLSQFTSPANLPGLLSSFRRGLHPFWGSQLGEAGEYALTGTQKFSEGND